MKNLLERIKANTELYNSVIKCEKPIKLILQKYITNFPDFTDHSFNHSKDVLQYAEYLLDDTIDKLTDDEIYVLIMAGYLHDIGMCPTKTMIKEINESDEFKKSGKNFEDYLREIHHEISYKYIIKHWEKLNILNEAYAEAIALVGMGHRVVDILDFDKYKPEYAVKSGKEFICLPFLSCIIRLADELDITNDRTPDLLYDEYLPDNKISKKEWAKHKANYRVNFNEQSIIVASKCTNKDLYYALLKQYKKIESVLIYAQKVTRTLPQNKRVLKLNYSKLDKEIVPNGFIPKEIGFSFDLQNTIDTFIGDNIYENKYIGIRECLQNSIDSCRYKLSFNQNYKPQIDVQIENDSIVIIDNGLGMDEFIVENYFGKLAKSYYQEDKIKKDFEAISQFGIGIFSYFLLCDKFLVETKMEEQKAIKYLVTKNADNYFYFYDKVTKKTSGTIVTLFLNDKISFEDLTEKIKHHFRFIEIPITLKYANNEIVIKPQNFSIDKNELLYNLVDLRHKHEVPNIYFIETKISEVQFDGIYGLMIYRDNKNNYIPKDMYYLFKNFYTAMFISEKGVFVEENNNLMLSFAYSIVNIKKRTGLNISRNRFTNYNVINEIEAKYVSDIFEQLFNLWASNTLFEQAHFTERFINDYLRDIYHFNIDVLEKCKKGFVFKFVINGEITCYRLGQILEQDEIILIISINRHNHSKLDDPGLIELNSALKTPLLVLSNDSAGEKILELFEVLNWEKKLITTVNYWYFKFSKKLSAKNKLSRRYEVVEFDNNTICAYPGIGVKRYFNNNNSLVRYYLINYNSIIQQKKLAKLFDEVFNSIADFYFQYFVNLIRIETKKELIIINELLGYINKETKQTFKLTRKDFTKWMVDVIWKTSKRRNLSVKIK
jgi:molecular chaperone HtpG